MSRCVVSHSIAKLIAVIISMHRSIWWKLKTIKLWSLTSVFQRCKNESNRKRIAKNIVSWSFSHIKFSEMRCFSSSSHLCSINSKMKFEMIDLRENCTQNKCENEVSVSLSWNQLHVLSMKNYYKLTSFILLHDVETLHCLLSKLIKSSKSWIVSKTFS